MSERELEREAMTLAAMAMSQTTFLKDKSPEVQEAYRTAAQMIRDARPIVEASAAAETDALRAALKRLAAEWEQFATGDEQRSKDPDFTRDERLEFEVRAQCYRGRVKNLRETLAGTAAEDRYAAGRLAGLREAAAVALAYEQKCDAEAEKHDWRKNDVASIPDAMRIKEAWEERGESALVIRESIEALERVAGEGA